MQGAELTHPSPVWSLQVSCTAKRPDAPILLICTQTDTPSLFLIVVHFDSQSSVSFRDSSSEI